MRIAVLTFEGFNELDSFIAAAMINRVKEPRLEALIVCPSERVNASMNGVVVHSRPRLARAADAVSSERRRLARRCAHTGIMGELA